MKSCPFITYGSRFFLLAFCLGFLSGCASDSFDEGVVDLDSVPMQRHEMTAGSFRLTTFSRIYSVNEPVTVYIEGDVRDWAPSAASEAGDTPDEYMGLRLAMIDSSDNLIFISHPCQFDIDDPVCTDRTWKKGRFADQTFTSINRALDHILASVPHPQLHLVGYSGGGAIAALLAARRHDVISLRTIAGNLDPDGNGRAHAVVPRDDYIDPINVAPRLAHIPQEHFVGDKDTSVPPFLTENFVKAVGSNACVRVRHVPEATHMTGWEDVWEDHASRIPSCGAL